MPAGLGIISIFRFSYYTKLRELINSYFPWNHQKIVRFQNDVIVTSNFQPINIF